MVDDTAWLYRLALTFLTGIGDTLAKILVSYCGSVKEVFSIPLAKLERIPGIGKERLKRLNREKALQLAEKELQFIRDYDITPLFYLDDNYPQRLYHCQDGPVVLYYKGNVDLNYSRILAIVGTRRMTPYGRQVLTQLINDLTGHDILILSGLAYGVDIHAHREALRNGLPTVGVLGHSLDRIYPQAHWQTSRKMLEQGGLLTEFPSGTGPDRENFPRRNRIIAGMADAILVIESGRKGGAIITADIANSYNRDVFAVPGDLNRYYSEGCNHLIQTNRAALFINAENLLKQLNWQQKSATRDSQKVLPLDLTEDEKIVLGLLADRQSWPIDKLMASSGLTVSLVSSVLLDLEFKGLVIALPGKQFRLA